MVQCEAPGFGVVRHDHRNDPGALFRRRIFGLLLFNTFETPNLGIIFPHP